MPTFQSTHPSGVRLDSPIRLIIVRMNFNLRTPVGCDLSTLVNLLSMSSFQSTHPSGVRRPHEGVAAVRWGYFNPRTPVGCDGDGCECRTQSGEISIHAPQWGATAAPKFQPTPHYHFNPRTPVGCDTRYTTLRCGPRNFNPRTPVGCDHRPEAAVWFYEIFQSTHPSGVRPREWA